MVQFNNLSLNVLQALLTYWVCPKGENFEICKEICPRTCANPQIRNCTEECLSDCFCTEDKVRSEDGRCVRLEECSAENFARKFGGNLNILKRGILFPYNGTKESNFLKSILDKKCPEGETFESCACIRTCLNPGAKNCMNNCVPGCFCTENMVRDESNNCVPLEQCTKHNKTTSLLHKRCPKGEIYHHCGNGCPQTCEKREIKNCTKKCVAGCFCPKGKIRRNDGLCVLPEDCRPENEFVYKIFLSDKKCPKDEQYNICGTACPRTCNYLEVKKCTEKCVIGCYCPDDMVRNENGKCIYPEDCEN